MSTRYPLQLQGFEGQSLEVRPSGLASGPKLLVNGQPATPGVRRGLMVLRRNDGREIVASLRPQVLGLDVPRLYVDGQLVNVVPPLPWHAWAWSALPILLVFAGGALGALAGFVTQAGVQGLIKEGGTGRRAAIQNLAKSVGGSLEAFYYAFGETDAFVLVDLPDQASAAAIALTVGASGGATVKTTVLMTPEEIDAASKKTPMYRAPGQ